MKKFQKVLILLVALSLAVTTAVFAISKEEKRALGKVYNATVTTYSKAMKVMNKLSEKEIAPEEAEKDIKELRTEYEEKTKKIPYKGRMAREALLTVLDQCEVIIEEYKKDSVVDYSFFLELDELKLKYRKEQKDFSYVFRR